MYEILAEPLISHVDGAQVSSNSIASNVENAKTLRCSSLSLVKEAIAMCFQPRSSNGICLRVLMVIFKVQTMFIDGNKRH